MAQRFQSLAKFLDYFKKKKPNALEDNVKLNSDLPLLHHELTHTRIPGDASSNIYGGAYYIPPECMEEFYQHYYKHVFVDNRFEYLTEKQLENESAILIDLDLKFEGDFGGQHPYTDEDIFSIIFLVYMEKLKQILQFEDDVPFKIYVFEKPYSVYIEEENYTKDGIHIIIGTKLNRSLQLVLRQHVLENIASVVSSWKLVNDWGKVVDESISRGSTNWQLYGSRKPNGVAYELTTMYELTYDKTDNEFRSDKTIVSETVSPELFAELSARNTEIPSFPMRQEYHQAGSMRSHSKLAGCSSIPFSSLSQSSTSSLSQSSLSPLNVSHITSQEILDSEIAVMISRLNLATDYDIKEAHDYALILPAKYYEPGSHLLNRKLAFALKATDPENHRLFLTWIKVRSKAADFDYGTIPGLYTSWCNHFNLKEDFKLSKRSIMFWAKADAARQFYDVRNQATDYFIETSLDTGLDYDFARTIFQMFKDEYVCSNLQAKPIWYHFEDHRWVKDNSNSLRLSLSGRFFQLYREKLNFYYRKMCVLEEKVLTKEIQKDDPEIEKLSHLLKNGEKNIKKLKQCSDKNNISKELADIFYDRDFITKMDKDKYLICFSNGVIDIKNKVFRKGYPDDYITKSTGIEYKPLQEWKRAQPEIFANIWDFFEKVFPIENIRKYMIDHLASCLIGQNINQTFTIYRGRGSNGKSLLTDFMALALGEYAGTVPVTLVTDKRSSVGSTTSELMQLKGVRYAVMQEPSKDAKINEGMMKQLTGDSQMQARELYRESENFTIQFSLVVSLNELFKIGSNDNGTWRRIRVVDFVSKFKSADDVAYNAFAADDDVPQTQFVDEEPYVFVKDQLLKDKLPLWAPCFASLLVDRVFQTEGAVQSVREVSEASDKYRREQDAIALFIKERLIRKEGESVKITEVKKLFKEFMKENSMAGTTPKDCTDFMNQNYKLTPDKKSYCNITIISTMSSISVEATHPFP
jgi:P4 family phage/plasmid primase-like protien